MIGLIIFSIISFILIWFIIFKVAILYEKKKVFKNMPKKLDEQLKMPFNNIKKVNVKKNKINIKELLGKRKKKKIADSPIISEDVVSINKTTSSVDDVKQKQYIKFPTLKDKFKLPGKKE